MHVPIWPADGIFIECASGDDHLAAAASRMGQRRTTPTAECRGKAARRRKIEARDMLLSEKPPKCSGFEHCVCSMSCPCCLSASRAVTVDKAMKRQGNLKARAAAKTTATYFHSQTPLVSRCRPVTDSWLLATVLPASREKLRTLWRRQACTPALLGNASMAENRERVFRARSGPPCRRTGLVTRPRWSGVPIRLDVHEHRATEGLDIYGRRIF
jgi:hypothetical protein